MAPHTKSPSLMARTALRWGLTAHYWHRAMGPCTIRRGTSASEEDRMPRRLPLVAKETQLRDRTEDEAIALLPLTY